MRIDISPEVWELWERSWALFGVKTDKELIKMLEDQMRHESQLVIEDAFHRIPFDTPEAAVQRVRGMLRKDKYER